MIAGASPALAATQIATSVFDAGSLSIATSASAGKSFGGSWNASTGDFGPGVGSGIFGDKYGWDAYLQTSGAASASFSARSTASSVQFNYVNTGQTSLTTLGGGKYQLNVSSSNTGPATFTMQGPNASANFSAGLYMSASLSGEACVFACTSLDTSLGSFSASGTVLGVSTANGGSATVFGQTITGLGANRNVGSAKVTLQTPTALTGGADGHTVTSDTDVFHATVDIDPLTGHSLEGSVGIPGVGGIGYTLVDAVAGLDVDVGMSGSMYLANQRYTSFYNPDGSYAKIPVQETTTQFVPTHGTYLQGDDPHPQKCDDLFGPAIPLNLSDPLAQQCFKSQQVTTTVMTSGVDAGSWIIGDGVTDLSHIEAITTTSYQLEFDYSVGVGVTADLALSALAGNAFGDSFGPLAYIDPNVYFPLGYASGVYNNDKITSEAVFFGGDTTASVPEPSTWAFMLVGFFTVGRLVRRNRLRAMTPAA